MSSTNLVDLDEEVQGFSSTLQSVVEEKKNEKGSAFYNKVMNGKVLEFDIGKVKALSSSLMNVVVHEELHNAAIKHFNNDKIDYIMVPARVQSDASYEIAPFGVIIQSKHVISEDNCRDASDKIAFKVCTGKDLYKDEIFTFVDQYGDVFPEMARLTTSTNELNDKVTSLVDTVGQNQNIIAYNQNAQIGHLSWMSQQQNVFMNDATHRLASLESMIQELSMSLMQKFKPISFSDQPHVQYDMIQDDFSVPSLENPGQSILMTDEMQKLSMTSANKQVTFMQQNTHIHGANGVVTVPKHINARSAALTPRKQSFAEVVKKSIKVADIRTKKGKVAIKVDLDSVTPDKSIEFIDVACLRPLEVLKFCGETDWANATLGDLHVSRFAFDTESLKAHEGTLCYTIYISGCSDPHPVYLIAKDDSACSKHQNSNGPACDIIISRRLAVYLGFQGVNTEYVAIPFIRKGEVEGFRPGMYAGRFGSVQRRWLNKDAPVFKQIASLAMDIIMSNGSILSVISLVYNQLLEAFSHINYADIKEVSPLVPLSAIYGNIPAWRSIPQVDSKVSNLIKTLPEGNVEALPDCIHKCFALKEERHGLMYGSHVVYNGTEGKYETPCGTLIKDLKDYWKHPCTVRARAIAMQPIHAIEKVDGMRDTNLRVGIACSLCGRRYADKVDATNCVIFCSLIPNGVERTVLKKGVLHSKPNPRPVTAFGQSLLSNRGVASKFQTD